MKTGRHHFTHQRLAWITLRGYDSNQNVPFRKDPHGIAVFANQHRTHMVVVHLVDGVDHGRERTHHIYPPPLLERTSRIRVFIISTPLASVIIQSSNILRSP